jgi:hypothetical protein
VNKQCNKREEVNSIGDGVRTIKPSPGIDTYRGKNEATAQP